MTTPVLKEGVIGVPSLGGILHVSGATEMTQQFVLRVQLSPGAYAIHAGVFFCLLLVTLVSLAALRKVEPFLNRSPTPFIVRVTKSHQMMMQSSWTMIDLHLLKTIYVLSLALMHRGCRVQSTIALVQSPSLAGDAEKGCATIAATSRFADFAIHQAQAQLLGSKLRRKSSRMTRVRMTSR